MLASGVDIPNIDKRTSAEIGRALESAANFGLQSPETADT